MKIFKLLGKKGRITIPYAIRQRVGFKYNDVLSFTESSDGRSVIVKRERICKCDLKGIPDQKEKHSCVSTLLKFLDDLSLEQQRAALIHLSLKWAKSETKKEKTEE